MLLRFTHNRFFSLGEGVSITSIKVPPAVESGSESVVLDCEYVLAPHEKQGLVVQWFFRDGTVPVYQWIPGKRPQVSGLLKGRINLEHRVSDDPYHRHRALEIINATTDLGGDYRCKVIVVPSRKYFLFYCNAFSFHSMYQVASFDNEDSQTARMAVYSKKRRAPLCLDFIVLKRFYCLVPAEKFTIEQTGSSVVNVTCEVDGVYPKPQMALFQQNGAHGSRLHIFLHSTLIKSLDSRLIILLM